MSRIYLVTQKNTNGGSQRYVRANTLNAAIRAHAAELFVARPVTPDEVYQASRSGVLDVLDAVAPEAKDVGEASAP